MKLYFYVILVAAAENSVQLANKVLSMEQLRSIYAAKYIPNNIYAQFYTVASPQVKVPNTMAWVCSGDLETDLQRYRQDHFQDAATEPIKRVNLYFFPGGTSITRGFQCYQNVECTIKAEWDGHHWRSKLANRSHPSGWDSASRTKYLDSRPDQIGVWFHNGRMLVTHTFTGLRTRRFVFNEALLVTGQLLDSKCGIWNFACSKAILNSFMEFTNYYPVGVMAFEDISLH